MKLKHLTLCFCILFLGLYSVFLIKDRVKTTNLETKERVVGACRAGVLGAAKVLADAKEGNTVEGVDVIEETVGAIYAGAAAYLGMENLYDHTARLQAVIPLICICEESGYILIHKTVNEGKLTLVSEALHPYGPADAGLSITENSGQCIEIIEKAIENKLKEMIKLKPVMGEISVDLPKFAIDSSVVTLSNIGVIAVAFAEDVLEGGYTVHLCGAQIKEVEKVLCIERNGGKEVHTKDCEIFKSITEVGQVLRLEYRKAVELGYLPSECCDPLGYCFADLMHAYDGAD